MVSHQGGLSQEWSLIRWSFSRVVSCQGGLSPGWSLIRVFFQQYGRSLIRMVSHQNGLSPLCSLITVVSHQGDLSQGIPPYCVDLKQDYRTVEPDADHDVTDQSLHGDVLCFSVGRFCTANCRWVSKSCWTPSSSSTPACTRPSTKSAR